MEEKGGTLASAGGGEEGIAKIVRKWFLRIADPLVQGHVQRVIEVESYLTGTW